MTEIPTASTSQLPDPLPPSVRVLDVREPVEWAHGHIEGATHVPLQQLPGRLADVPQDGDLLVVCKVGGRSSQAVAWLSQQGVTATNLEGGMLEWAAAGRPMVSDTGQEPQVV